MTKFIYGTGSKKINRTLKKHLNAIVGQAKMENYADRGEENEGFLCKNTKLLWQSLLHNQNK